VFFIITSSFFITASSTAPQIRYLILEYVYQQGPLTRCFLGRYEVVFFYNRIHHWCVGVVFIIPVLTDRKIAMNIGPVAY
jgi:hypothetical protein